MRRFLTVIVVLVLLVVAVDRVAWWFAQRTIADQVQNEAELATPPEVKVGGFPFLTQVLRGKYTQIDAVLENPEVPGGLKIDRLNVKLQGVQVSTSEVINRQVQSVPVDAATAVATVSYATLNETAKENLAEVNSEVQFSQGADNSLQITGEYRSSGFNAQLDLSAKLVVQDGDLVVQLPADTLNGLPAVARSQVRTLVTQASRLPSLPYGFQARSVTMGATGVTIQAESASLKLER